MVGDKNQEWKKKKKAVKKVRPSKEQEGHILESW